MRSNDSMGFFTASNVTKLMPTKGSGVTRDKYIMEVAQERVLKLRAKEFTTKSTDHGLNNQVEAITEFANVTGFNVKYLDEKFFKINDYTGATPDGCCEDFDGNIIAAVEAKCPVTSFFQQKMLILTESKPEFQNCTKEHFFQAQMQMMALGCEDAYLVRYLTKMHMDDFGNKTEFNLPISIRLFYKHIKADKIAHEQILAATYQANLECEKYVELFMQQINSVSVPEPLIQTL